MEWIHCHIARQPVPPGERMIAVPAQLSAIVMKLLAKTAEERYQTAAGVETDLRGCQAAWESSGRIDPFPLSMHDASDRLMIPERLYGRERETDTLLAVFERVVAHGTTELVLVSGYSGIGKSSVLRWRKVRKHDDRRDRETKLSRRQHTPMAGNDHAIIADQHRVYETELRNRASDLCDLGLGKRPSIARMRDHERPVVRRWPKTWCRIVGGLLEWVIEYGSGRPP
jgi:hypothetical protein